MRVLFVASANRGQVSAVILNQADSIQKQIPEIEIDWFHIHGKGIMGYLRNIQKLKSHVKQTNPALIHAHYSYSGMTASLAFTGKPVVCSLMGSDVYGSKPMLFLLRFFNKFLWSATIVKSQKMKDAVGIEKNTVVSNGVDMTLFKPMDRNECVKSLGWDTNGKHVLFAADPSRYVKNFPMAEKAFSSIDRTDTELHVLGKVSREQMPIYLNAADTVLLTSLWEGSPNVIKEAMSCNTQIVTTNVGDVDEIIGDTEGCYVCKHHPAELATCIGRSLERNSKTEGRSKIQHLDSSLVARRIEELYQFSLGQ